MHFPYILTSFMYCLMFVDDQKLPVQSLCTNVLVKWGTQTVWDLIGWAGEAPPPWAVADLRGGAGDACPPMGAKFSLISCSFWEILIKSYPDAPPWELAPPPRGNPGSATAGGPLFFNCMQFSGRFYKIVSCRTPPPPPWELVPPPRGKPGSATGIHMQGMMLVRFYHCIVKSYYVYYTVFLHFTRNHEDYKYGVKIIFYNEFFMSNPKKMGYKPLKFL